jgi:hypothetical protein
VNETGESPTVLISANRCWEGAVQLLRLPNVSISVALSGGLTSTARVSRFPWEGRDALSHEMRALKWIERTGWETDR